MSKPIVILNFKAYPESVGKNAIRLAEVCDSVRNIKNAEIMLAVQPTDIFQIKSRFDIKVLAQHVDSYYGKYTGSINALAVKDAGAYGTLLNHAEKKIEHEKLSEVIKECKRLELITFVCAADLDEVEKVIKMKPDFIAFEIPELIGTDKSITDKSPESVKKFVEITKKNNIIPLCGAGINSRKDVETAIKLGTEGILLSSAFVKAKDHRKFLIDLIP